MENKVEINGEYYKNDIAEIFLRCPKGFILRRYVCKERPNSRKFITRTVHHVNRFKYILSTYYTIESNGQCKIMITKRIKSIESGELLYENVEIKRFGRSDN